MKNKIASPGQAHSAGAVLSDKIMEWGADGAETQRLIEDKDHPIWDQIKGYLVKTFEKVTNAILKFVKTVTTDNVAGSKNTADCFTNKERYHYCDSDLDGSLPKIQNGDPAGNAAALELIKPSTFKEMAEAILEVTGDVTLLSKSIIERGLTVSLITIELLIELQEKGEDVGLRTDGYANFFFVEDKDGQVSVVDVRRDDGQWAVFVYRLGHGLHWGAGRRVFLRNFKPSVS